MKKAKLNETRCDKAPYCGAKRTCPVGAIEYVKEGLFSGKIVINQEKCIGCSQCVAACPHNAISMK
jgi:Fe-S-cluster-containing hydrogenase component 2